MILSHPTIGDVTSGGGARQTRALKKLWSEC
jgi:hypothetical protein